jgi:ABC-type multidrug transport system ATPase subunit
MRYPQSRCFNLDEPTTGLDPNQLIEIRDVIKNAGKDKTIFSLRTSCRK